LGTAIYCGHTEIVHLLRKHGADVNLPGEALGNAFWAAIYKGYTEIVCLLLEHGADVNLPGGEHGNALGAAIYCGHTEIVHLLLKHGADVNLPGGKRGNALGTAIYCGYIEIVHLLLEHGADVNLPGGEHDNVLNAACYGGHIAILRLLLENDAIKQNLAHHNALSEASGSRDVEICLLLENSVNSKAARLALRDACEEQNNDIVASLRETSYLVRRNRRLRSEAQGWTDICNGRISELFM
jgi:ankyrin repeat protein